MAIGISYTGHDGRRMDFTAEGNPEPGSDLDRIVRGADGGAGEVRRVMTPLADAMRRARRPQGPDPRIDKAAGTVKLDPADHRPGTLADKVDVGGSIEASQSGMRLKGDGEPKADGLYAKKNGRRGFFSLDEIDDPNAKGGIVGEQDAANRFAASNKEGGGDGAFSENMQSRTEAEVNEETGEVTFWEYTKRWDVTNGRRVGGVSGETKRKICSFFLGGGDRQITYTRPRAPFTVLRSHYKDANGKTQYEFWAKCLKWGKHRNETQSVGAIDDLDYSTNRLCSANANGVLLFDGVYGAGDYGHYPQRPEGRPRKLVFDSGREALVDVFEERSTTACFHDGCNCWTYIGGSEDGNILGEDCEDGNMSLYGAFCRYPIPYKTTYQESKEQEFTFGPILAYWDGTSQNIHKETHPDIFFSYSGHWDYSWAYDYQMCITAKQYKQHDLFEFLMSCGALVASAYSNDDYDKNCFLKTCVCKGTGETLFIGAESPCYTEGGFYAHRSGPIDRDRIRREQFPSLAQLEGSLNRTGSYLTHDYEYFKSASHYTAPYVWTDLTYPQDVETYKSLGLHTDVRDMIVRDGDSVQRTFFNCASGQTEEYNGKWSDYFPFFVADEYGFVYTGIQYINVNAKTPKVCEIRNWEIVENEVGNLFCYVKENAKGEILDVQLKKFGDVVKDGKEDVVIKDDLVVVEK